MLYTKETTRIENQSRVFTGLNYTFKCNKCGDEFKSRSLKSKYCSTRCKNDIQIYQRALRAAKKRETFKNCIICNDVINQKSRGKIKKYCSSKCKQRAYRNK